MSGDSAGDEHDDVLAALAERRRAAQASTATVAAPAPLAPWGNTPEPPPPTRPRPKSTQDTRPPTLGLPAVMLLALAAAFFSWVSAEPLWLAIGHGTSGALTVTQCHGKGAAKRCLGDFIAPVPTQTIHSGRSFAVTHVVLAGDDIRKTHVGAIVPARMVSARARTAYAGKLAGLNLRWIIGLVIVALCGFGVAWALGVWRLRGRPRYITLAASLGAPLLFYAGALIMAY